jgi:hypothetical protein
VQFSVDEQTAIAVQIDKQVVPASQATVANAGYQNGWYVEFNPLDKFKSIQIASQVVGTLPADIVYYGSRPLRLPDTLLSVVPIWDDTSNSGVGDTASALQVDASASATCAVDGDILVTMQHGFNGEAVARFTKRFLSSPPAQSSIPTPTQILPSYGTVAIIAKGQSRTEKAGFSTVGGTGSVSVGSNIRTKVVHIGPVLTAGLTAPTSGNATYTQSISDSGAGGNWMTAYSIGLDAALSVTAKAGASATGSITVNIPPSTPTAITSGTWILDEVKVEQWRLGIWVMLVVEVLVP